MRSVPSVGSWSSRSELCHARTQFQHDLLTWELGSSSETTPKHLALRNLLRHFPSSGWSQLFSSLQAASIGFLVAIHSYACPHRHCHHHCDCFPVPDHNHYHQWDLKPWQNWHNATWPGSMKTALLRHAVATILTLFSHVFTVLYFLTWLSHYPPVIKHGNGKSTIYGWFSHWNLHLHGIFQLCLMKPED